MAFLTKVSICCLLAMLISCSSVSCQSNSAATASVLRITEYNGDKVSTQETREYITTVVAKVDKLLQPQNMAGANEAGLRHIKARLDDTKFKLVSYLEYPAIYRSVFENYNSLLGQAQQSNRPEFVQDVTHFIEKDLEYKYGDSSTDKTTGALTLIDVEVRAVNADTGEELEGYRVTAEPYLLADPQARIEFPRQTKNARQSIPPGWYRVRVTNSSGRLGERPITLLYAHRNERYPVEIPVKL